MIHSVIRGFCFLPLKRLSLSVLENDGIWRRLVSVRKEAGLREQELENTLNGTGSSKERKVGLLQWQSVMALHLPELMDVLGRSP